MDGVEYQKPGLYWNKYLTYANAFRGFCKLIGETGPYFSAGKYTIGTIGPTYCNGGSWVQGVTQIALEIMKYYTGSWSGLPPAVTIESYGSNENLINAIKNCIVYYKGNGFSYCMGSAGRLIPPYSGTPVAGDFSNLPVRQSKHVCNSCSKHSSTPVYRTDCSTYVSWVIYEYASAKMQIDDGYVKLRDMFDSQVSSGGFEDIADALKRGANTGGYKYMTLIWHRGRGDSESVAKSIIQEGDILIYREGCHHVDFSSGTWGKVYSCGSPSGINAGDKPSNGKSVSKLTAIIRLK